MTGSLHSDDINLSVACFPGRGRPRTTSQPYLGPIAVLAILVYRRSRFGIRIGHVVISNMPLSVSTTQPTFAGFVGHCCRGSPNSCSWWLRLHSVVAVADTKDRGETRRGKADVLSMRSFPEEPRPIQSVHPPPRPTMTKSPFERSLSPITES